MESFLNFKQDLLEKEQIKKRKPTIRIAVQIDENHLENNIISFKDLFYTKTYQNKPEKNDEITSNEVDVLSSSDTGEDSKTDIEDITTTEEEIFSNEEDKNYEDNELNEKMNELMKNNQPIDIKKAVFLRDSIEKKRINKLENELLKKKKRKFYEYYDINDPFIDDSEDCIIENSLEKTNKETQNFVVWSGKYGNENKRKCNKTKQTKIDNFKEEINVIMQPNKLLPLNPRIAELMIKLKNQSDSCNWYEPNTLPESIIPLLKRILKIAEKYNYMNLNFYEHLRLSLKYQYHDNIEFLKNKIEIMIIEDKIQKKMDSYEMYLELLKSNIKEYKKDMDQKYKPFQINNKENFSNTIIINNDQRINQKNQIRENFLWNDESRLAVYHIVNLKCQIQELKTIKEEKLNPDFKINKNKLTKKQIYQKLSTLWPESTMNPQIISKEYIYINKKNKKLLIESSQNKPQIVEVPPTNKYIIKILDKIEEKDDTPIIPIFIKSSSKFYPNHEKKYKRQVIKIPDNERKDKFDSNNKLKESKISMNPNENENNLLKMRIRNKKKILIDLTKEEDNIDINNNKIIDKINNNLVSYNSITNNKITTISNSNSHSNANSNKNNNELHKVDDNSLEIINYKPISDNKENNCNILNKSLALNKKRKMRIGCFKRSYSKKIIPPNELTQQIEVKQEEPKINKNNKIINSKDNFTSSNIKNVSSKNEYPNKNSDIALINNSNINKNYLNYNDDNNNYNNNNYNNNNYDNNYNNNNCNKNNNNICNNNYNNNNNNVISNNNDKNNKISNKINVMGDKLQKLKTKEKVIIQTEKETEKSNEKEDDKDKKIKLKNKAKVKSVRKSKNVKNNRKNKLQKPRAFKRRKNTFINESLKNEILETLSQSNETVCENLPKNSISNNNNNIININNNNNNYNNYYYSNSSSGSNSNNEFKFSLPILNNCSSSPFFPPSSSLSVNKTNIKYINLNDNYKTIKSQEPNRLNYITEKLHNISNQNSINEQSTVIPINEFQHYKSAISNKNFPLSKNNSNVPGS